MSSSRSEERRWRVCVTRDEGPAGPLAAALHDHGFEPVPCPVLVECGPDDPQALARVAAELERFTWIVCASVRAVRALASARGAAFPAGVRTAAVGRRTAEALLHAGASPPPVVPAGDGAEALWDALRPAADWPAERVLVVSTPGGRRTLADALTSAGATVEQIDAYRMTARDGAAVAAEWRRVTPDALVVASPRVAVALAEAVGADALRGLRAIVAIGPTTAAALATLHVPSLVPAGADFADAARLLADRRKAWPDP
ncbi:MAG TPA: uroporphyrinogen-III synthase [Vicinamibacterales bacterium]|nr:uroporphyrinogen-III synthase [Vicinamibacterales bacterium]